MGCDCLGNWFLVGRVCMATWGGFFRLTAVLPMPPPEGGGGKWGISGLRAGAPTEFPVHPRIPAFAGMTLFG